MATALDKALVSLNDASNFLEKHRPTLKEVKGAKDAAKNATDILAAAVALMERDIYDVAEAPTEAVPLFDQQGAPAPGAAVEPQEPANGQAYDPDFRPAGELHCQDAEVVEPPTEDERKVFHALMDELKKLGLEDGLDKKTWSKHRKAWETLFAADHKAAVERLKERVDHWHPLAWGPDEEKPQPQHIDELDAEVAP
jgi:hypothetical protein